MEFVVAVSENDVIGRRNGLPWRLPADLRRFKALTMGKPILMGRKTYQSIGRALPGRRNIVLTRSTDFAPGDCIVVATLAQARAAAGAACQLDRAEGVVRGSENLPADAGSLVVPDDALMVIGGAQIYRECLPLATRIHLTLVHTRIEEGDAFFEGWRSAQWRETFRERHDADEQNAFAYSFLTLDRVASLGSRASMHAAARA